MLGAHYLFNPSIKELPSFHTPDNRECEDYGLPLSDIIATVSRKAKSVYERYLISERGRELIAKADEYEIPYDILTVDFLDLRDRVEEFEEAIEKANSYGIDWKNFGYDLLAIEQEISELVQAEREYLSYNQSQYQLSQGVEV